MKHEDSATVRQERVAVVLVNFRGWRDTLDCVASLLAEGTRCALSVVVCENGSPDDSWVQLHKGLPERAGPAVPVIELDRAAAERGEGAYWAPGQVSQQVVLVNTGANLGFAGGCNVGARWAMAAGADRVWLLNNDTEVAADALGALLRRLEAQPRMGLCGSKLVYADTKRMIQARGGAVFDPKQAMGRHIGVHEDIDAPEDPAAIEAQMDYVIGASMMATRDFIARVGWMTEDYFLFYEELDWAERGRREGFTLGYAADSVVFHKEGATIGTSHRQQGSLLSMRYLSRNRLTFTRRFHPDCLGSVRRRMWFEVLVFCKRRQWSTAWTLVRALWGMPP